MVRLGQVTCSAVSGKSLARTLRDRLGTNTGAIVPAALDHLRRHLRCIAVLRGMKSRVECDGGGHPVHSDEWPRLTLEQSACQGGCLTESQRWPASAAACLSWVVMGLNLSKVTAAQAAGLKTGRSRRSWSARRLSCRLPRRRRRSGRGPSSVRSCSSSVCARDRS